MKTSIKSTIGIVITALALIIFFSTSWVLKTFQITNFDALLFTILMPTTGASRSLVLSGVLNCLIIPLVIIVLVYLLIKYLKKISNNTIIKIVNFISSKCIIISILLLIISIVYFCNSFRVDKYINNQLNKSTIYEEYYVDPKTVNYTFPEKKRNLIFICLESIETSFYSKEQGGALNTNVIPELYDLAVNNITFTDKNNQGYHIAPNTGWTISSNVGSLCGVPIGSMFVGNRHFNEEDFLPGAYGIGDILKANGYTNEFMCGEDANFASTNNFFRKHGGYTILDYNYAINQGWIPSDYKRNWGFEDDALFQFAKAELTDLASQGKPFNLFISTLDTHSPDGYVCEKCENNYDFQMLNVLRCSSKQVNDFVNWIKEQPFYENTTIVIMGDHQSMSTTLSDMINPNYTRKPYFTIINSAQDVSITSQRTFCTFDIFPTTLSALGVKFNSDRLALGTNLFSNTPTLMEELGDKFFTEVSKTSDYYNNKIVLNK